MIKSVSLSLSMALALIVPYSLSAEVRVNAGLWENSVTTDGKTVVRTHCITDAEAQRTNLSPQALKDMAQKAISDSVKGACTLKEFTLEGNRLSQLLICGKVSYATATTYHGDSFETTSASTKGGVTKVSILKGRRTGVCP